MNAKPIRGQGALEYLLLIGGAVLVGTVVLLIAIGSTSSTTGIINDNIDNFTGEISLNTAFGGGGGPPASGCSGGAPNGTCDSGEDSSSCPADCTSGADNNPPSISLSAVDTTAGGQIQVTYSAVDSVSPPTLSGLVYDSSFSTINGLTLATFNTHPSYQLLSTSPLMVGGLTDGTGYYFRVASCDSHSPLNCALSSTFGPVVPTTAGPGPAYLSGFTVTPQANTAGFANYNYSWTVTDSLPAAFKNPIAGIVPLTSAAPAGLTFDDGPAVTNNFYAARNPVAGTADALTVSSGNGTGKISNTAIKTLLELFGGTGAFFGIAFEQVALPGKMELFLPTTASSFPPDTEAPSLVTLTSGTGAGNGGQISLSFTNPSDQYLGTTYTTPGGLLSNPKQHEVAWSNTASDFTDFTTFNAIPASQKKVSVNGNTAGAPWSDILNYNNGLVPSSAGNFVGVKVCDQADTITASISNCYVVSGGPYTASKESVNKQSEDPAATVTSLISDTTTYPGFNLLKYSGSGCGVAGSSYSIPVTFLQPASSAPTYRVFFRYGNLNGVGGQRVTAQLGTSKAFTSLSTTSGTNLVWSSAISLPSVPASTNLMLWHGTSTTPTCTSNVYIDRVIATTSPTCVPTLPDGSDCA